MSGACTLYRARRKRNRRGRSAAPPEMRTARPRPRSRARTNPRVNRLYLRACMCFAGASIENVANAKTCVSVDSACTAPRACGTVVGMSDEERRDVETEAATVQRLREVIAASRLTPNAISELAGLNRNWVSQYLAAGGAATMTRRVGQRLADALGVSVGWLLAGEGPAPSGGAIRGHIEEYQEKKRLDAQRASDADEV